MPIPLLPIALGVAGVAGLGSTIAGSVKGSGAARRFQKDINNIDRFITNGRPVYDINTEKASNEAYNILQSYRDAKAKGMPGLSDYKSLIARRTKAAETDINRATATAVSNIRETAIDPTQGINAYANVSANTARQLGKVYENEQNQMTELAIKNSQWEQYMMEKENEAQKNIAYEKSQAWNWNKGMKFNEQLQLKQLWAQGKYDADMQNANMWASLGGSLLGGGLLLAGGLGK